jgi:hypothetical protein
LLDEGLAKANLFFIAGLKGASPFAVAAAAEKASTGSKPELDGNKVAAENGKN